MCDLILVTLIQLILTWVLVGVTWFSQIIHYPLYMKIKEGFVDYERSHIRRTALLVGPIMLAEAVSAVFLMGFAPPGIIAHLATSNLILLIVIWLATFLFQISLHQKLSVRFSKKILHGLIACNWIRTVLTTLKGCVMAALVYFLLM